MVKLEEVEDEAFLADQPGPEDEEDAWNTDSESDISSVASDSPEDESFYDRIAALKDVVPPLQRRRLASTWSATSDWGRWGALLAGKGLWAISASLLLLGVPFALASTEDQQIAMEEKQMNMQASANEILTAGAVGGTQAQRPL